MVSRRNLLVAPTWLRWYPGRSWMESRRWICGWEYQATAAATRQEYNINTLECSAYMYNRDPDLHWLITASGTWNVLVVIRSDPIPYYLAFITKITIQNIFFKLIFSVNIYSKVKITSYKCVVHEDLQYNDCCVPILTLLAMHWVRKPGISFTLAVWPSFSLTSCRIEAITTCTQVNTVQ